MSQSVMFLPICQVGNKVQDTETLKAQGFVEYRDLVDLIAKNCRVNSTTLRDWLATPLSKVRSMLIEQNKIVLPEDRDWACLYSTDLVMSLTAYVRWHKFGSRHSVASVVKFFQDFERGSESATKHLPPRFRNETTNVGAAANNVVQLRTA